MAVDAGWYSCAVFSRAVTHRRGRRSRPAFLQLALLAVALLAGEVVAQTEDPQASARGQRPRIGLVLSGGGARGAAHVGVLKVLEELRVPVDAIAGTSMGAVVGGLYASGLSAGEIEAVMTSINWQEAFRDRPPREDLTLRRKQEDENFLVKFPLGVRGRRFVLPKGLLQGQRLSQTLRRLTLPVASITDFDQLPTPFRAVATDLETGEVVVMASGDLTSAMRASMSAPGVFAPVEREGRLLVDGGVAENLPVDVARAMGVDVLIVVDVDGPLLTRDKLTSVPVISNQMLAILIQKNAGEQLQKLTGRDILIQPPLGDASSFDFGRVARAIGAGERAARGAAGRLAALAVPDAEIEHYFARRSVPRQSPPRIDFVQVETGAGQYSERIAGLFKDMQGKGFDPDAVARRVTTLYGEGSLDTLDYRVVQRDKRYGLTIDARGSSLGPNYVRFGLNLQDDFQGHSTYNAAARFVFSEVTRSGGEWVWDGQIGANSRIASELFLPVADFSGWFVMPHGAIGSRDLPLLQGQSELAVYRVHTYDYGLDFGRQFGNWGEIRIGAFHAEGHSRITTGDPRDPLLPQPAYQSFATRNYFLRFSYDRLDDINFPHHGQQAMLQWSGVRNVIGEAGTLQQVTGSYLAAHSFGRDTLSFSAAAGATLEANPRDIRLWYPLGGFLNLSGLRANSLLGPDFGLMRLLYYRQIGRGGPGYLDAPTYLGVSLEAGNAWRSRSEVRLGNTRRDASLFLGMDTFLGPIYLATGFDDRGNQAFYLFLGRTF